MGFAIYDLNTENTPFELTVEQAGSIVTCYAEGMDISTCKGTIYVPRNIIEAVYKDISEIEASVIRAMKGESKIQLATYDEEGNELTPIIYNVIPTSLDDLKTLVFNLILRDYSDKVSASYVIQDIEDLRIKVYYCIDEIIRYSKSTKDGDWTFFSQQF